MLTLIVMLRVFVSDLDLSVCDLQFRDKIHYTYERDDGLVRSWIDHILCSRVKEFSISNIYRLEHKKEGFESNISHTNCMLSS